MQTGNDVKYFLTDHLGSTNALADSSGNITSSASYDSFGNATGNLNTRYQFTGREFDNFTGLHYYRARWYDGNLGRFISEDPIGFAGGDVNLYGYVKNNSLNLIDPLGLQIDPSQVRNCDVKCQQDIEKMNRIFNKTVGDMNSSNKRLPTTGEAGGWYNNFLSSTNSVINYSWEKVLGNRPLPEFEGCIVQADTLKFDLSASVYNNRWVFDTGYDYYGYENVNPDDFFWTSHKWVKVTPRDNEELPTLRYDAWKNESKIIEKRREKKWTNENLLGF